jgi:uncharacterized repeat protein (TIGR03803 family)
MYQRGIIKLAGGGLSAALTAVLAFALSACEGSSGASAGSSGAASPGGPGSESVLYAFTGNSSGSNPVGGLVQGGDGNFYGTSSNTVFRLTPAGVLTVLHTFGGAGDGVNPDAGVVQGSDGNFYGTTETGGASSDCSGGCGTVYQLTPAGVETVLYSFAGSAAKDGAAPEAALVQGSDGSFYGTTRFGGVDNQGTVFRITPAGAETVLYSFDAAGSADGAGPVAPVLQGRDGNFYGTTQVGGAKGDGTAFQLTPGGIETVLYSFGAGSDGIGPVAGLAQGSDGNFYGTTQAGGKNGDGAVFKLTAAGVETLLYSFAGADSKDGSFPDAALLQGSDGNFYGTTQQGGLGMTSLGTLGTVFSITPTGAESVIYAFGANAGDDGASPVAGLLQGHDGNFYGTTFAGGPDELGTVYRINGPGS